MAPPRRLQRSNSTLLGQVCYWQHRHPARVLLQPLIHPVIVAVQHDRRQIARRPLLGPLLHQLEQVLAVLVVPQQVHVVDDQHERPADGVAPPQRHLLQLVEGALNVEQRRGVARAANGKQRAHVVLVVLEVQRLAQPDAEDLQIPVRFEHRHALPRDPVHGVDQHGRLARALLADHQIVMAARPAAHYVVHQILLAAGIPVAVPRSLLSDGGRGRLVQLVMVRSKIEDWIARLESALDLLEHQIFVVPMVAIACKPTKQKGAPQY